MNAPRYEGSKGHLLDLIGRDDWRQLLMPLVAGKGVHLDPDCVKIPIGPDNPKEWSVVQFCSEYCKQEMGDQLRRLDDWWVKSGTPPTWDLIVKCHIDGSPGILLVEAKAHVSEMHAEGKKIVTKDDGLTPEEVVSRLAKSLINHGYIGRCIHEARDALRSYIPEMGIDRDKTYQLSNRIATAWKLSDCGIPTVLLYLGFTGDAGIGLPLESGSHWEKLVLEHLGSIGASKLPVTDVRLSDRCPLRFCIGSIPATRQSIAGSRHSR